EADHLVFPSSVNPAELWNGPHLVISDEEGARLERWCPGRIERANGEVVVRYASDATTFGRRTFSTAKFRAACPSAPPTLPPAGTFLEILKFSGQSSEVIRCHAMSGVTSELSIPFPPPDRYL